MVSLGQVIYSEIVIWQALVFCVCSLQILDDVAVICRLNSVVVLKDCSLCFLCFCLSSTGTRIICCERLAAYIFRMEMVLFGINWITHFRCLLVGLSQIPFFEAQLF
jgi:hypothetical protein